MNKNIKRGLCIFATILIIAQSGYAIHRHLTKKQYPYYKDYTQFDQTLLDEVVVNGVLYLPPNEKYRLEVIGDRVSAVRKYYLVDELRGFELRDGDVVCDGEVFRPLETRAAPVSIEQEETLGEKGF